MAASSLQVFPGEIQALATAARVAGPGVTWIRDTRDSPLDAHRGTYTSFQEFLSDKSLGADAEFNRLDLSNSSYYGFDKNRFVLARNTRYGQVRAFGTGSARADPTPRAPLLRRSHLPARFLFQRRRPPRSRNRIPHRRRRSARQQHRTAPAPAHAPLAWQHRQLRPLPRHGQRLHQRRRCLGQHPPLSPAQSRHLQEHSPTTTDPNSYIPTGPTTSTGQQGTCSFNYFSHAPGVGLRYHTPVGPIRLDFSYNLNPPIFPVNINYSLSQPD